MSKVQVVSLVVLGLLTATLVGFALTVHRAPAEAASTAGSATPEPGPSAASVGSVYYVGDSLADGWNASRQELGFRPLVTATLGAKEQANYIAGATLAEVSESAAPPESADLVIIELGTNDVAARTPLDDFRAGYRDLIARTAAGRQHLVCVGVWQTGTTAGFDDAIRQLCDEAGGRFVQIGDLREDARMVAAKGTPAYPGTADGAHPNDSGHAEIAKRILAAVTG